MNAQTPSSLDLLSKLLAVENLRLVRENVKTASFDITTRTLRIPAQMTLSEPQELLMVLHEVGHALFTTEYYITAIKSRALPNFDSYMNVVEDARIERLMKVRYPGAKKDFLRGYSEFHTSDFFRVGGRDVQTLPLIDRINLYFKLGLHVPVKFSADERELVRAVEVAKTEVEVEAAALALYEHVSATSDKPHQRQPDTEDSDSSGEQDEHESGSYGEQDEHDSESDDGQEPGDGDEPPEEDESSDKPAQQNAQPGRAETQDAFDGALEDSVMSGIDSATCGFEMDVPYAVRSYVTIVQDMREVIVTPDNLKRYALFKSGNAKIVNAMVKEFNMRRAAAEHKRSYVAKTGALDATKLCQYRIADDLFQRYQISATATNHGVLILLDWSGSISGEIRELLGQVITVVEFCRRVGIKYEVYAFSSGFRYTPEQGREFYRARNRSNDAPRLSTPHEITMLQLFASGMSAQETDLMCKVLYTRCIFRNTDYRLEGTPLSTGTLFAYHRIAKFRQQYNLEKVNLVILTDGQDTSIEMCGQSKDKVFIRDEHTNRSYLISTKYHKTDRNLIQRTLLRAIKDRYPFVTVTGFFVCKRSRDLWCSLWRYTDEKQNAAYYDRVAKIFAAAKRDGATAIDAPAHDRMIVLLAADSEIDVDLSRVNSGMTASQIGTAFKRAFNSTRGGRVVAKEFVQTMA